MIRMILSSFYNTLIKNDESIDASTMMEIDRLRHNNKKITVLTNRLYNELLYYNRDFPFIDYIISFNGAIIYDVISNKIIYEKEIDKKVIKKVKELFPNKKIIYYLKNEEKEIIKDDKVYKIEIEINKNEKELINLLDDTINKSIFKYNNKFYIEINSNSIINSIDKIMKKENIKAKDLLAIIGNDSEKDIINFINNTYVVSNSIKELKERAKFKTKSNEKKGLEEVLRTL